MGSASEGVVPQGAFVLHGHFYQPPREDPWTETVPVEPSAAPFPDWNNRITAESYRPNGWARVFDEAGRVIDVVNNYRLLSFNVGPTLLSWLAAHAPDVYRRILDADRDGGRAIAQAYGHAILPLSNDRDLRTQVRWGVADFRRRFGREPAGLWLPETAVDQRVLAVLAEEDIGFTILAPHQVEPATGDGAGPLDPVYRWQHPQRPDLGLDLVVYDGDISHGVAFGGFESKELLDRVVHRIADHPTGLVTVACDGETFGHHRPFAERGVAHALTVEAPGRGIEVPSLVEWLTDNQPSVTAEVRTTSWSCAHGVGRWLEDCGCHTGGDDGWNQAWRAPLRAALDLVRDHAIDVFERRGGALLRDPWACRDAYVDVLLGAVDAEDFAVRHLRDEVAGEQWAVVDALTLLESQRHALLMYTSCGWFFHDLAGIETLQVLRYAARCCDLLAEVGEPMSEEPFLDRLAEATSNRPDEGDGRAIWARHVEPRRVGAARSAGRLAAALVDDPGRGPAHHPVVGGFTADHHTWDTVDGPTRVAAGRVGLTHRRTRRTGAWVYAALRTGPDDLLVGVRPAGDRAEDDREVARLVEAVRSGEPPAVTRDLLARDFAHWTFTS